MRITIVFLTAILISFSNHCVAQLDDKKIEEYLHATKFAIDSEAAAIVLFERTDITLILEGADARQEESVHRIIKILKRTALTEADVKVFSRRDNSYTLKKIRGTTYNLDGNLVRKTELPGDDKYKTKLNNDVYEISFTMPDVVEGSIIEFSYKKSIPLHYVLPTWNIQDEYPKLISIYSILYSDQISFGYRCRSVLQAKEFKTIAETMNTTYEFSSYKNQSVFSRAFNNALWVRKNIQAARDEPYVVNMNNQKESMGVMITENRFKKAFYVATWEKYNTNMWEATSYMRGENYSIVDTVKAIVKNDTNKLAKAKAIFNYVRTNYKVSDDNKVADYDLKTVFLKREGYSYQINSLLIAMLNKAGLEAYMLMTSSTNVESVSSTYPMPHLLRHAVCALLIDSFYTFLDASNKNNLFGLLPLQYYNGYARVISKEGDAVILSPDLIEDINMRMIEIKMLNDSTQNITVTNKLGLVSSCIMRKALAGEKSNLDKVFEKYIQGIADDVEITNKTVMNGDKPDTNLVIKMTFQLKTDPHVNRLFLNASYIKLLSVNPFTAATREYPIEFTYRTNSTCQMNITLPPGFTIDSIPKPLSLVLDNGTMNYSKNVTYYPEISILASKTVFTNNKTVYDREMYDTIRDFYEGIIKEENKVIELRRK